MTIKEARRILGKEAIDVLDEDIEKDIEAATLFKDLFFNQLLKNRKQASKARPNVP